MFICKPLAIFVSVYAGQSPKDTEHVSNQVLQQGSGSGSQHSYLCVQSWFAAVGGRWKQQ